MSNQGCTCLFCEQTHSSFGAAERDALSISLIWMMERQWQGGAIGEIIAKTTMTVALPQTSEGQGTPVPPSGHSTGMSRGISHAANKLLVSILYLGSRSQTTIS